ncbi:hypothetical protein BV25DRAFT_1806460 [Artomyces pyxidatus]|uniref:Uncharacterized protein n=1 Tax=Artomyces pyxidatus TaxID=48021 RepID=A0ACB8SWL5_9AGAM|nr:hypothetical protein BV25DRAFT_1806460 [Artomyces pyxidatus]
MDFSQFEPTANLSDWDENDVQLFLSNLGLPQYENQVREHNLTGPVLCIISAEDLKEVGIATVGQRLAILKAVYQAKLAHGIPIEAEDYVPPSEAEERPENVTVDKLYDLIRDQDERLRNLEQENKRLSETVFSSMDDFNSWRSQTQDLSQISDSPITRQPSFKWAQYVKSSGSPTKAEASDSPHPSPHRLEHDTSYRPGLPPPTSQAKPNIPGNSSNPGIPLPTPTPPRPTRQDSTDNLKSFKVSLEDPAWKVLPAALRKYKINNDDWQNYAMFICYGPPSNRIERCLSYDEKPLLLFQKLKDASKNPVFMLKHIKDIRSPIAVAQQKQAARKASGDSATSAKPKPGAGHGRTLSRPPRLQVHADGAPGIAPALMTGMSAQPGWPEVMSPAIDNRDRADDILEKTNGSASKSGPGDRGTEAPKSAVPHTAHTANSTTDHSESGTPAREVPVTSDISYAVAIYPYMAEQEDEFDVVVGDTFVIISRARGWWVVQRDPTGTGVVDSDTNKQGWVPAGCLLETRIPVATAIAEANGSSGSGSQPPSPVTITKTPILPLNIVSTSFPGYALMDYKKKGDEELDLVKDDTLRVFKRYNHWSYAVKEDGGDRGWVPSWYIGKVSSSSGTPATPSMAAGPNLTASSVNLDEPSAITPHPQVSPMSSAFPPQARATTVI